MAISVASVVTEIGLHLPVNEVDALAMLNIVNAELQYYLRLTPDVNVQVSLVAGQQEYSLLPNVTKMWSANYQSASGTYTSLTETNVDRLDYENKLWRVQSPATPCQWYERGGNIGFYPCPDVSTTNGYPIVNVTCSEQPATLDINGYLPSQVFSCDAWVYRCCMKLCIKESPDKFEMFSKLAEKARQEALDYIYGRVARDKPSVSYRTPKVFGL